MAPRTITPKKLGTLLVLSTYPIRRPRHGGQLRSAALIVEYKKAFSKVVRTAVFNSSVYTATEYGRTDIPSPADLTQEIVRTPELEAWILGESPITSGRVREQLTRLIETLKPETIVFEQPFLYLGMKELLSELNLDIPLIYSSHNVESEMMRDIFSNQNLDDRFGQEIYQLEQLERELANRASGTVAVSEEDAAKFLSWGAKNIIVQGNGARQLASSRLKRLRVRRVMKKLGVSSYALYVGSSHRPNIDGFVELLGSRLGYLPAATMIFLAGDVARGVQLEVDKIDPLWGKLMWSRVFNWDRVSERTLSALIEEASCIILPIISGGGSNLKSAEAIVYSKPIICTSESLRGFGNYLTYPQIQIASSPNEFRAKLIKTLAHPHGEIMSVSESSAPLPLWENQLSELVKWLLTFESSVRNG
jgi:hypothetical protein